MRFKTLLMASALASVPALVHAETISILMESVPDTRFVQEIVPQFTEATGIEVEIEVVNYAEMHPKLVPQLVASEGSYDVIVVDFYWVGEFIKAGWLQPLDDRIAESGMDTSVYVPVLFDLVGQVDGTTYMLPFYNYAMGLTYRTDLLADPDNQAAFEAEYGMPLQVPTTWDEYKNQVAFFTDKDQEFYGVVNQGLRPDPIAMEWSNYLFANGGQFYDENWNPTLTSPEAVQALNDYIDMIDNYGPVGAASFGFDEAFNVAAQGLAYSYLTYNMFRTAYDDPEISAVVGNMELAPVPNGGLNGAWGWAIPVSSPDPDAAWQFLEWVESFDVAQQRAMLGGSPTRFDVFDDEEVNATYSYYPALRALLDTSHNFPVFTYTPELVDIMGRELSLAVVGDKTPEEALAAIQEEFTELARRDGKIE